jgi:hypothetical protein
VNAALCSSLMGRGRIIGALLLALVCAGVLAGAASAARPGSAEELAAPAGFELRGSHGYLIVGYFYVEAESEQGWVALTASRGHESASYYAPAKVTADSVRADLGGVGRVDLVLHRSGLEKTVSARCSHRRETFEAATYEGIVDFHGERGFTRARATRVAALPIPALLESGRNCELQSSGEARGPSEPGARLAGISFTGGRTLKFQFNKNRASAQTTFTASLNERRDGVRILRQFTGVFSPRAFHFDPKLRTATLTPPSPFSGSAKLRRDRDSVSPRITGNLMLALPGRSVSLVGPDVHVSLVHARRTKGNDGNASIRF